MSDQSQEVQVVDQERQTQLAKPDVPVDAPMLPVKQTEALMVMIQGVTSSPNMTEETIKIIDRLWEMQKESQDRDAKVAYAEAKARAQKNMPGAVGANRENDHTHSTYSDLAAVNEIVPIYSAEGFSLDFKTRKSENAGDLTLVGTLLHEGGHSEEFPMDLPLDDKGSGGTTNKTQIQARASTYQYCQRILTCQIWNIATDHDRDGNGKHPPQQQAAQQKAPDYETITEEQALTLHSMVNDLFAELGRSDTGKRADSQMKVLAESMGSKKIGHLPADRYDEAVLKTKAWMIAVKEHNPQGEGK